MYSNTRQYHLVTGLVRNVTAIGCGIVGWTAPADKGPGITSYIVQFFTGNTFGSTSAGSREKQILSADQTWAKATNLPSIRPVYSRV